MKTIIQMIDEQMQEVKNKRDSESIQERRQFWNGALCELFRLKEKIEKELPPTP